MAYDQETSSLQETFQTSDLSQDVVNDILGILGQVEQQSPDGQTSVDTLSGSGTFDDLSDIGEITGGGSYNADSDNNIIISNTNENLNIQFAQTQDEAFVIVGGGGDDVIVVNSVGDQNQGGSVEGGAGNDSVVGGTGNDSVAGGAGNDSISAGSGRDIIELGIGADSVDGGTGFDTAKLGAGRSSYTVTVDESGNILISDAIETNTLKGVEFVQFDDGSIVAGVKDQVGGTVARLYEAMLGREADASGLEFWLDQSGSIDLKAIARGFEASAEFQSISAGKSDSEFLDLIYSRTFNRDVDEGGRAFWETQLAEGKVTRAELAADLAYSEEATNTFDYVKIIGTNFDLS